LQAKEGRVKQLAPASCYSKVNQITHLMTFQRYLVKQIPDYYKVISDFEILDLGNK
jgi:hypothetical protein